MRPAMRTSAAAVIALFALAACHSRKGRYLAGTAAATDTSETSSEAHDVDALWMVTLPPVTVLATPPAAARTSLTPTTGRRSGEGKRRRSPHE